MDLRHLAYFVAVAEELSFTAAAQRLHVVQSTISAGVRLLERELAIELFSRGGRQVALSAAGASLLPEARGVLAAAQGIRDLAGELQDGVRGSLRIASDGFVPTSVLDLAALFARFHATHPRVTITLDRLLGGVDVLTSDILGGRTDLGIVACRWVPRAGIDARRIAAVPLVLACHPDHRLATEDRAWLHQVADEPFVDLPLGTGVRTAVDHAFGVGRVERRTLFDVPEVAAAVELVRRGLGVAVVAAEPTQTLRGIHQVPIGDPPLAVDAYLLSSSNASGSAKALVAEAADGLDVQPSDSAW